MKPKVLLLDAFGIAVDYNIGKSELGFAQLTGLSHEEMVTVLNEAGRINFAWGNIDHTEFHLALNHLLHHRPSVDAAMRGVTLSQLICQWTATYSVRDSIKDILAIHQNLNDPTPVFWCSNANEIDIDWLTAHGLLTWPGVRGLITSSETGAKKSDPNFFHRARDIVSKALNEEIALDEMMLVDSDHENVRCASRLNIDSFWYVLLGETMLQRTLNLPQLF